MTEKDIIEITTNNVFEILRKAGFEIIESKSAFQKTEQLLYLIPELKKAIKLNKLKIEDLQKYGIQKRVNAVHIVVSDNFEREDEQSLIHSEISKIKQRNHILKSQIKWTNNILSELKNDKYFKIIELKYFKGKTYEEIADFFGCDTKTIGRNKSKLINSVKNLLFPNDALKQLSN